MDRTPRYAEMSEKAPELQALWKPRGGDWFAIRRDLIAQSEHYALKGEVYQVAYVYQRRIHFVKYIGRGSQPEIRTYHLGYLHQRNFKLTWLPTQSQLQDILKERTRENRKYARTYIMDEHLESFILKWVLADFLRWAGKEGMDYSFTSLEQFWLAFCMHEVYKKNWDHERREWGYLTRGERKRAGYIPLTA